MTALIGLFVYYSVVEFGELSAVPTTCRTDKVTCDSLELVYVCSSAVRTFLKTLLGVFKTAVHASVAVVVYGAVSDVVLVHKVYD